MISSHSTATAWIYTLSLHDALPICFFEGTTLSCGRGTEMQFQVFGAPFLPKDKFDFSFTPEPNFGAKTPKHQGRSEEHTSELQSRENLVCRLLLEKKKNIKPQEDAI